MSLQKVYGLSTARAGSKSPPKKNLVEMFDGIKIIKVFQKEKFFLNIFLNDQKKALSLMLKNNLVQKHCIIICNA